MSTDIIELTTEKNKHKVVIRNYTTRGDDKQAEALLNEGMKIQTGPDGQPQVSISAEATSASSAKYVELLVQSIDGKTEDILGQLDALHSEDYRQIADAVHEIASDPKDESKS